MQHVVRAGILSVTLIFALGTLSGCGSDQDQTRGSTDQPSASASSSPRQELVTAGPAPKRVGRPTRVLIADIGVNKALYGVGLKADGAMETPAFGDVGWYDLGPRPGARGPAVIVAHVHGPAGDDVFADLDDLERGDRITVRRTDGVTHFVVDSVEESVKEKLPVKRIWKTSNQALLRLITCAGTPDPTTRMYPANTVVYAHAVT